MKNIISILTAIIFFFTVSSLAYGGDDSWAESEKTSENVSLMIISSVAVITLIVFLGIQSTRAAKAKNEASVIFNEATSSHGERSNLEILAKLYEISVDEVIDTISTMVVKGEIDMAAALADDEAAWEALARLNQALEAYSRGNGKNHQGRLEKFREKFKTEFPDLTERPTTLELASFYHGFFKEINTAGE